MELLGHVSAAMSLRYGRLFDATVRAEYERALTLAKAALTTASPAGAPAPRLSSDGSASAGTPLPLPTSPAARDWRDTPTIKSRLAGGFCLRAPAQGSCAYANICEHCPNFRTDAGFLAVLAAQRADAAALAADAERPRLGRRSRPAPPPRRPPRPADHPRRNRMTDIHPDTNPTADPATDPSTDAARVRAACEALAGAGADITFTAVAAASRHQPRHLLPPPRPPRDHRRLPLPPRRAAHPHRAGRPRRQPHPSPRRRRRESPPPRRRNPRAQTPRNTTNYPANAKPDRRLAG